MRVVACPTCGHDVAPVKGLELRGGALFSSAGSLRLGPVATAIVRVLMRGPSTILQLVELVYGSAPDVPEFPENSIQSTLVKLRRSLSGIGWTIGNSGPGHGGGSVYLLAEVEEGIAT